MPPKQQTTKANEQPLLTSTSVAASLSPPRFPPHDSNLRQLYKTSRHPHLPTSLSIPDQLTRFLGTILPLDTQHSFRDSGYFRAVADTAVKLTCPSLGIRHWKECKEFIELSRIHPQNNNGKYTEEEKQQQLSYSKRKKRRRWTRRKIAYGDHSMQYIDIFLPTSSAVSTKADSRIPIRGTIFFVHGGAWGAGHPWMYRLVAPTFLKLNFAVCIVGYRTYPDAKDIIEDQIKDVQRAWEKCGYILNELVVPISDSKSWVGNVVMGHSSGAHVGLLMLVEWIGDQMKTSQSVKMRSEQQYPWIPNYFIGLSGPYDISYHFDYEGGRGVEQISPLKPICGHTRENFNRASPVKRLLALLPKQTDDSSTRSGDTIQQLMPPILLMHGIEDTVVPFTATSDAGRQLRSCGLRCDEIYLSETGHQDVIMHVMLGGKAKEIILDWLFKYCDESGKEMQTTQILSRL